MDTKNDKIQWIKIISGKQIKILHVSMANRILGDNTSSIRENFQAIAQQIDRIDRIVYSHQSEGYQTTQICNNGAIYPTNSICKVMYLYEAYRIGCQLQNKNRYNLIYTSDPIYSGWVGYWLKRKYRLPLLILCHSDYYSNMAYRLESLRHPLNYLLSLWLIRKADTIQVVSHQIGREVIKHGVNPERVYESQIVHRTQLFKPGENTLKRYSKGQLLFVGRLVKTKGLIILLKAVQLLLNRGHAVHLTIIGSGPLKKKLERLSVNLGIQSKIDFVGQKKQEELVPYYQTSSLFILPSYYEAAGHVIVEAGLCGCPTIATHVGGIPENVIHGKTGILIPPRDASVLSDTVSEMLNHPKRIQQMGREACRSFQRKWNYHTLLSNHITLLKKTVQRYRTHNLKDGNRETIPSSRSPFHKKNYRNESHYWDSVSQKFSHTIHYLDPFLGEIKKQAYLNLIKQWEGPEIRGNILKTDLFEEAMGPDGFLTDLITSHQTAIGIDLSESMTLKASIHDKKKCAKYIVADVRNLPFKDRSFTFVVSPSTLDHFHDPTDLNKSLDELGRVSLYRRPPLSFTIRVSWQPFWYPSQIKSIFPFFPK